MDMADASRSSLAHHQRALETMSTTRGHLEALNRLASHLETTSAHAAQAAASLRSPAGKLAAVAEGKRELGAQDSPPPRRTARTSRRPPAAGALEPAESREAAELRNAWQQALSYRSSVPKHKALGGTSPPPKPVLGAHRSRTFAHKGEGRVRAHATHDAHGAHSEGATHEHTCRVPVRTARIDTGGSK